LQIASGSSEKRSIAGGRLMYCLPFILHQSQIVLSK